MDINKLLKYKTNGKEDEVYVDIDRFMNSDLDNYVFDHIMCDEHIVYYRIMNQEILYKLHKYGLEELNSILKDIKSFDYCHYYREYDGKYRNVTNKDMNNLIDEIIEEYNNDKDNDNTDEYELG